jgi:hypothetical protein
MKTNFFEDNGGMIHAFTLEDGSVKNYLHGFEQSAWDVGELLRSAALGFEDADPYDPDEFGGVTLEEMYHEIAESDEIETPALIAEISPEWIALYPKAMGAAGRVLFGLGDD